MAIANSNKQKLVVDVTTLLKWNRPPVGIIRTQLEFVNYLLIHNNAAKYFSFNDSRDSILEISSDEIRQKVKILLNFKSIPKPDSTPPSTEEKSLISAEDTLPTAVETQNPSFGFSLSKRIWSVYKNEGSLILAAKICIKFCPSKLKDRMKIIYHKYLVGSNNIQDGIQQDEDITDSIEPEEIAIQDCADSLAPILFSPEILIANSINNKLFTKNSIVISIGLDWDHSNYPLLYWLKQKIGFEFVGALYDVIPVTNPELIQSYYFSQMFFSHLYYLIYLSDRIFCISDFSKSQIQHMCILHNIKNIPVLKTIHLGSSIYRKDLSNYYTDRNHKKKYILYVSTIEARKNHILLLKVWQKLQKEKFQNLPDLLLVGMMGWGIDEVQDLYQNDEELQKVVHFYDDVDDEELVTFYKNSLFTVFPSLIEGWGLGAVESMLYGKVCIISTCNALKEATQGLMPSLDPSDVEGWSNMVKKFVSDPTEIDQYTELIHTKFKSRSWDQFGAEFSAFAKGQI